MATAKKITPPPAEYQVELTLTQTEAEDLRSLLWSHVAGPMTQAGQSFRTIQTALARLGVATFNLRPTPNDEISNGHYIRLQGRDVL